MHAHFHGLGSEVGGSVRVVIGECLSEPPRRDRSHPDVPGFGGVQGSAVRSSGAGDVPSLDVEIAVRDGVPRRRYSSAHVESDRLRQLDGGLVEATETGIEPGAQVPSLGAHGREVGAVGRLDCRLDQGESLEVAPKRGPQASELHLGCAECKQVSAALCELACGPVVSFRLVRVATCLRDVRDGRMRICLVPEVAVLLRQLERSPRRALADFELAELGCHEPEVDLQVRMPWIPLDCVRQDIERARELAAVDVNVCVLERPIGARREPLEPCERLTHAPQKRVRPSDQVAEPVVDEALRQQARGVHDHVREALVVQLAPVLVECGGDQLRLPRGLQGGERLSQQTLREKPVRGFHMHGLAIGLRQREVRLEEIAEHGVQRQPSAGTAAHRDQARDAGAPKADRRAGMRPRPRTARR